MLKDLEWYAYLHENGNIFVRRYIGPDPSGDIDEARASDCVNKVVGPFVAPSKELAYSVAKNLLDS